MAKIIVAISEKRATVKLIGTPCEFMLAQVKKNQAKADRLTASDLIYNGEEKDFFYDWQREKFLKQFEGLKNVEIKNI